MSKTDYIRAGRLSTPIEVLERLAQAPCSKIRARVAENCSSPPQVLERLSRDQNIDVRIAVGWNPKTPPSILWKLALDCHVDVRFSLADNANTASMILIWLSEDENPYIAHRALKTMEAVAISRGEKRTEGGSEMSAKTIERMLRRMLTRRERLTGRDAVRLKDLILEDGYLSRSERKILHYAIENGLLEDEAFEIFLDLILDKGDTDKAIA